MLYYILCLWNGLKRNILVEREDPKLSGDTKRDIRITFKSNRKSLLQTVNTFLQQSSIQFQPSYDFSINFYQLNRNLGESPDVPEKGNVGAIAMEYIVGFIRYLSAYTEDVSFPCFIGPSSC